MPNYSRLSSHERSEDRSHGGGRRHNNWRNDSRELLLGETQDDSIIRNEDDRFNLRADRPNFGDESGMENNVNNEGILHATILTEGNSSNSGNRSNEHIHSPSDDRGENGLAWQSAEELESQSKSRGSRIKERIMRFLPQLFPVRDTYDRLSNGLVMGRMQLNAPSRFIGQGTDGVFRNLMAKPDRESTRLREENNPPSYEEAAADAAPEYWESTVAYPMYEDEVFVTGLPVGNAANLIWNILVTTAFQFVGFVLCYLLHTSHAAKQGARIGLGVTFMYYGWQMTPTNVGKFDRLPTKYVPSDANAFDVTKSLSVSNDASLDTFTSELPDQGPDASNEYLSHPYYSYGVLVLGIFIIIKSIIDYYQVKQMEKKILSPSTVQQSAEEGST